MRVLSWNLFHGRAQPAAGRPLLDAFSAALAGWSWDVALLQEVPPWWAHPLAAACGADPRSAMTSRNAGLPLRRILASRWPDLLRSNGGGANVILVRPPWTITAHGRRRLRWTPERRVVHAVRLHDPRGGRFDGAWIGNVHGQLGRWDDADGTVAPRADLLASIAQLERWAGAVPPAASSAFSRADAPRTADIDRRPIAPRLVLGGDLNLPRQTVEGTLTAPWHRCASHGPDHVVGRAVIAAGPSSRPDRGVLSDHAPLTVELDVAPDP